MMGDDGQARESRAEAPQATHTSSPAPEASSIQDDAEQREASMREEISRREHALRLMRVERERTLRLEIAEEERLLELEAERHREQIREEMARFEQAVALAHREQGSREQINRLLDELDVLEEEHIRLRAERNEYWSQLSALYASKAWKVSTAYWRARREGARGLARLGTQVALLPARAVYRAVVPERVRKAAWFRRHTGMDEQAYRAAIAAQAAALGPSRRPTSETVHTSGTQAGERPGTPVDVGSGARDTTSPDALYFAAVAWDADGARTHQLASRFAQLGHRTYRVSPRFLGFAPSEARTARVADGMDEVCLPGDAHLRITRDRLPDETLHAAWRALRRFCEERDITSALCVVEHSFWLPLVRMLRARYGWKVVCELTDEQNGDGPMDAANPWQGDDEALASSDLVVTTSEHVRAQVASRNVNTILLAGEEPDAVAHDGPAATSDAALAQAIKGLYGKASIIVVTYNNLELTRQTLASVLAKTRYPKYEIIVVDNGSAADLTTYLTELAGAHPNIKLILNEANLGFAKANNLGIAAATESEFIVLLNIDVVVISGWLGRLIHHLADPRIGLVGPLMCLRSDEVGSDGACSGLDDSDRTARRNANLRAGLSFDVPMLDLSCVAMRRALVNSVGTFDEQFSLRMFDEEDYGRRVRDAGFRIVCAEDVVLERRGMGTPSRLEAERQRTPFDLNRARFETKWSQTWTPHRERLSQGMRSVQGRWMGHHDH